MTKVSDKHEVRVTLTTYQMALIEAALQTVMKPNGPWESPLMQQQAYELRELFSSFRTAILAKSLIAQGE